MPSPRNQNPENRRFDWPGIFRTLLVQVLVLSALSWGFVRYVNWSSDRAWAEFSSASERAAPAARPRPPSTTPDPAVRVRSTCARRV
ncbi:MAG: hypothetical protein WB420_14300 [Bradyrhizobium sp.]